MCMHNEQGHRLNVPVDDGTGKAVVLPAASTLRDAGSVYWPPPGRS